MKCKIYCGVTKNLRATSDITPRAMFQLMEASVPVELKSGKLGGREIAHDGQLFDNNSVVIYVYKSDIVVFE